MIIRRRSIIPGIAAITASCIAIAHAVPDMVPPEVLRGLKDQEFQVREASQKNLLDWARQDPQPRGRALLHQARTADDPEVRLRCHAVLRSLSMDAYLDGGEGYMGITMDTARTLVPGEEIQRTVILITRVMPDSPASEAGLRVGDMIESVNKRSLDGVNALPEFQQMIRQLQPGKKADFGILRGGDLIEVAVVLGRRPPQLDMAFFGQRMQDLHELARREQDEFFKNWIAGLDK